MTLFHGLAAYPITPRQAGMIDHRRYGALVGRLAEAGVDAVGALGSTGGYAFLEREDRRAALGTAVAAAAGVPVIAGIGAHGTDAVLRHVEDAQQAGAAALLLAPLSYTPLTPEEVLGHVSAVAAAVSVPIVLYDNPPSSHTTLSDELLTALTALPHVEAVKLPFPRIGDSLEAVARTRALLAPGTALGVSGDAGSAAVLAAGADGVHSVTAGVLPVPLLALARAALAGGDPVALSQPWQPLWTLFGELGSIRVVTAAATLLQLAGPQLPRPLIPLHGEDLERVRAALQAAGALAS